MWAILRSNNFRARHNPAAMAGRANAARRGIGSDSHGTGQAWAQSSAGAPGNASGIAPSGPLRRTASRVWPKKGEDTYAYSGYLRGDGSPSRRPSANAYIDFSKMTAKPSLRLWTDVVRDGRRVVGYGFNSNGRYGQGGLIRERFRDRVLQADPATLLDATGVIFWTRHRIMGLPMMANENARRGIGGGVPSRVGHESTWPACEDAAPPKSRGPPLFRFSWQSTMARRRNRVVFCLRGGRRLLLPKFQARIPMFSHARDTQV